MTSAIPRRAALAAGAAIVLGSAATGRTAAAARPVAAGLDDNKRVVTEFYRLAFNEKRPREAADRYLDAAVVQHSPDVADGAGAWVFAADEGNRTYPEAWGTVARVLAQDDLVVLHTLRKAWSEDRGTAAFAVYRVAGGRIAEHWDVTQPVPERTASGRGMTDGPDQTGGVPDYWLQRHSREVRDFTDLVFNQGKARESFGQYVDPGIIQHDPEIADGWQPFMDHAVRLPVRTGDDRIEVVRTVADGKFVFVHARMLTAMGAVVTGDLWRVSMEGKYAEHWKATQNTTWQSASGNPPY